MKRFAIIAHDHADASDKRRTHLAAQLAHVEQKDGWVNSFIAYPNQQQR